MPTQTTLTEELKNTTITSEDMTLGEIAEQRLSPLDKLKAYDVPVVWNIGTPDKAQSQDLAFELAVPPAVGGLYLLRGLDTVEKVKEFQRQDISMLHDPWLLPDIVKAIDRTEKAIRDQEHIHVHGDYDVDGVTSVAIMAITLKRLKANFTYHTPHRIYEGYGLSPDTVDSAVANSTKLLISVDCGIRDFAAARQAKMRGLDLIVTDHHLPPADGSLPDAFAVVNPARLDSEYPFKGLAGCGVALKFVTALCERFGYNSEQVFNGLAEYVAMGTVADMMPMMDENRFIVSEGLKRLGETKRVGLQELIKVSRVKVPISTTDIGFGLAPRINAAGRLSDSGIALDLVLEAHEDNAKHLAKEVELLNIKRQEACKIAELEALDVLPDDISDTKIVVLKSPAWHSGIVGLVAQRLTQALGRPSMIAMDRGEICKGSCRSTDNFHILNAMNYVEEKFKKENSNKKAFIAYGGHAMAAGFSIGHENMLTLYKSVNEYAEQQNYEPGRIVNIDMKISTASITPQLYASIQEMAPFGEQNMQPVFLSSNLEIVEISTLKENAHLKLKLKNPKDPDRILEALWWRNGNEAKHYSVGNMVDIAYSLSQEEFRGAKGISLILQDMRLTKN